MRPILARARGGGETEEGWGEWDSGDWIIDEVPRSGACTGMADAGWVVQLNESRQIVDPLPLPQ